MIEAMEYAVKDNILTYFISNHEHTRDLLKETIKTSPPEKPTFRRNLYITFNSVLKEIKTPEGPGRGRVKCS